MNRLLISATIFSLCLWAAGCKHDDHKDTEPAGHHKMADMNMTGAVANIEPTKGNTARGTVMFQQMGDKVRVIADITGLAPNSKHGFHVHEGTECGDDGMLAKGHYNPEQHQHGLPSASSSQRHAGDFGNITADGSGKAHLDATFDNISISGAKNPIMGHALIIHADPDDGSQPVGNAGKRIGCGIIKAGGKTAMHEHHEPIALGGTISRPEIVNTLINPPHDRISSSVGVNQVDWFRLPSLNLPQTILSPEPQRSDFTIDVQSGKLPTDIMGNFINIGPSPDLRNVTVGFPNGSGRYGVLITGSGPDFRGKLSGSTTKTGGGK